MAPKAARKTARAAVQAKPVRRPKRLPEMDDPRIDALHNAALDYAEVRDRRQALTKQEVELKDKLLGIMHANEKTEYRFQNVWVRIVHEKETVKVRVKKDNDDPSED